MELPLNRMLGPWLGGLQRSRQQWDRRQPSESEPSRSCLPTLIDRRGGAGRAAVLAVLALPRLSGVVPGERGLSQLVLEHADVFQQLPDYADEALVASHMRHATHIGFPPEVLEASRAPWRGAAGQAAWTTASTAS